MDWKSNSETAPTKKFSMNSSCDFSENSDNSKVDEGEEDEVEEEEDGLEKEEKGEPNNNDSDVVENKPEELKVVFYMCSELNIKNKVDKDGYQINAITFIQDSKNYVVIDHRNRNFKLIDYRSKTKHVLTSVFQPWDIATFNHEFLVVTFPFVRLLQFLKLKTGNCIEPWYPVLGGNEYYGVAVHHGCIVASCRFDDSPNVPSIHYINKDGIIVNIIHTSRDNKPIFAQPSFIAVNEKKDILYVSDCGKRALIALTEEGNVIAAYCTCTFLPKKICINKLDDTVFVASAGERCVIKLSKTLVPMLKIGGQNDSIPRPLAVQYCNRTDKLYVSNDDSSVLLTLIV